MVEDRSIAKLNALGAVPRKTCCAGATMGAPVPHDWPPGSIQLDYWRRELRPDGTPTGHIVRERGRAIGEVYAELRRRLEAEELLDEGLSLMVRCGDGVPGEITEESEWPRDHRHVACFAVTGANEGWYSYVELLWNSRGHGDVPRRKLLFLTKTFDGMDRAYQVAKRCAELLGA